jgi:hypothetical protein
MHTSNLLFGMFWGAVIIAMAAQVLNYLNIPSDQRTRERKAALALGLLAAILGAVTGFLAATDWGALPTSYEGLRPGQLWNDGGIPAIVQ